MAGLEIQLSLWYDKTVSKPQTALENGGAGKVKRNKLDEAECAAF